jgi:hypothetical protein
MSQDDLEDKADRRRRRSADPLVALHYQLSSVRALGELDAIVVADISGVVVAGAGSWPVCEELAAYAPLLAEAEWGTMTAQVSSRVDSLRKDAIVRSMQVGGQEVLLCARRQRRSEAVEADAAERSVLDQAVAGVSRILSAAA